MTDTENIRKGDISVDTAHIFPIIKKWLYSDKEIFLRELISNACDAITKHKRLCSLGEINGDDAPYRIQVSIDKALATLTISDNGIGMNEEEVDKYINQIALSGAVDFIEKYESAGEANQADGIIGHFGLGFYSAFMIADNVEIKSKSYRETKVRFGGREMTTANLKCRRFPIRLSVVVISFSMSTTMKRNFSKDQK